MMTLQNEGQNPPGCFWYLVPETGTRIPPVGTSSLLGCYERTKEHYRANGYAIPGSLRETIEDFCCKNTLPGQCREDHRMVRESYGSFSMALARISQGAKSLASWLTHGVEGDDVARHRAGICLACPENQPIDQATCSGCQRTALNRFSTFVAGVLKGSAPELWERGLEACRICGCPLRLKIRTKLAPIRQYMHPDQLAALPTKCWINTEQLCEPILPTDPGATTSSQPPQQYSPASPTP